MVDKNENQEDFSDLVDGFRALALQELGNLEQSQNSDNLYLLEPDQIVAASGLVPGAKQASDFRNWEGREQI